MKYAALRMTYEVVDTIEHMFYTENIRTHVLVNYFKHLEKRNE